MNHYIKKLYTKQKKSFLNKPFPDILKNELINELINESIIFKMNEDDEEDDWDDWMKNYVNPGTFSRIKWPTMKRKIIYIGDSISSSDYKGINERNIKHIVSLGNIDYDTFNGIKYHRIMIDDSENENIIDYMDKAIKFIDKTNSPVLIHCQMGISRSVSIMIGYLISKGYDYYTAYNLVKASRNCANPNFGFQIQLMNYHP
jgi:hypothetical protein